MHYDCTAAFLAGDVALGITKTRNTLRVFYVLIYSIFRLFILVFIFFFDHVKNNYQNETLVLAISAALICGVFYFCLIGDESECLCVVLRIISSCSSVDRTLMSCSLNYTTWQINQGFTLSFWIIFHNTIKYVLLTFNSSMTNTSN